MKNKKFLTIAAVALLCIPVSSAAIAAGKTKDTTQEQIQEILRLSPGLSEAELLQSAEAYATANGISTVEAIKLGYEGMVANQEAMQQEIARIESGE